MLNVIIDDSAEERMEALGVTGFQRKQQLVQEAVKAILTQLECRSPTAQDYPHLEAFLESAGSEGSVELTEDVWKEILAAKPEEVDPDSLALPPGWRPS